MKKININKIKPNENNPRFIKDDKFKELVKSIQDFPEMLELRPIVVDENHMVLGGNMRLRACKEAGIKDVPIKVAEGLTEEQKREFIIKDNIGFGQWDWDILANEWDSESLNDWGLYVPEWKDEDIDYSERNNEINIDDLDSEMVIKLKYPEKEYLKVKKQLLEISQTPENAVWKLLGNE